MAGANREQLISGYDSVGIVKSCNELACKQDSGLVAPMSLSSSWCLVSILSSRLLSTVYQPQWNSLICMRLILTHPSKCHSLCACIYQGWADPKTLWLEPCGWDISSQWKCCCTGWQGFGYTRPAFADVRSNLSLRCQCDEWQQKTLQLWIIL